MEIYMQHLYLYFLSWNLVLAILKEQILKFLLDHAWTQARWNLSSPCSRNSSLTCWRAVGARPGGLCYCLALGGCTNALTSGLNPLVAVFFFFFKFILATNILNN